RPPRIPQGRARAWRRAPARHARARSGRRRDGDRSAERTLQLLEEALVVAIRVGVARRLELEQQLPLLLAEAARHRDVDEHAMVAPAEALQHRHALAAQHANVAGLGPRRQLELDGPVQRLDRLRRTDCGLDDRQVDLRVDVVPRPTVTSKGTVAVTPLAASVSSISTVAPTSAPRRRVPRPNRSSPKNAEKRSLNPPMSNWVGWNPPERRPACPWRS